MLTITDSGCNEHKSSQFTFSGDTAYMIKQLIVNLHKCGAYHSYICEYGHTHSVIPSLPLQKIVSSFPKQ
jgi:hypothetical protein